MEVPAGIIVSAIEEMVFFSVEVKKEDSSATEVSEEPVESLQLKK